MLSITTVQTATIALTIAILTFVWQVLSWLMTLRTRVRVRVWTITHAKAGQPGTQQGCRINILNRSAFPVVLKSYTLGQRGTRPVQLGPWLTTGQLKIESRADRDFDLMGSEFPWATRDNVVGWAELPGRKFVRSRGPSRDLGTLVFP